MAGATELAPKELGNQRVDVRKLEPQEVTVLQAVADQRRQAIVRYNEAINGLFEQWAGGPGKYESQGRPDGVWLVRVEKPEGGQN